MKKFAYAFLIMSMTTMVGNTLSGHWPRLVSRNSHVSMQAGDDPSELSDVPGDPDGPNGPDGGPDGEGEGGPGA